MVLGFVFIFREERTIGQVVRQEFSLVELHRQVIDPCRSTKPGWLVMFSPLHDMSPAQDLLR